MPRHTALYANNFYSWAMTTAALIRAGQWQELDRKHLAEEIEGLGISQEHALSSIAYRK